MRFGKGRNKNDSIREVATQSIKQYNVIALKIVPNFIYPFAVLGGEVAVPCHSQSAVARLNPDSRECVGMVCLM